MSGIPTIVGVDLSTSRLDCALVPAWADEPLPARVVTLHIEQARTKAGSDSATRCGNAARAMRSALALSGDVACVAIEEPFGPHRNVDRALLPILGALTGTCALVSIPVAWYAPDAWRKAIGCKGSAVKSKALAHDYLRALDLRLLTYDSDQLDAIGVALAHRQQLDARPTLEVGA